MFNYVSLITMTQQKCLATMSNLSNVAAVRLYLGADVVQFSISESPQDMLCCITTNPKIQRMQWGEELSPHLSTAHTFMHNMNERMNENNTTGVVTTILYVWCMLFS